jgi:arginyl-tRNA--protein-N-Asp/Glu arginylyltransferase
VHDHEQHIQDTGKVLRDETRYINEQIEQARQNLAEVEKQIKEVSKFADTFILPDPKKEDKANQIFNEADKVYKTITAHQELLIKLDENIKKFCVLKSKYLDNLENLTLWDEYSDARHKHAQNYETNSIDIVSFGFEDEFFRGYISVHKRKNESVFDQADKSIENYSTLILETKIQYAAWEEFLKRTSYTCNS